MSLSLFVSLATLAAPPTAAAPGEPLGTSSPTLVLGVDPQRRWAAVCQAREDTDGDGEVHVRLTHHGENWGDALQAYFIEGHGAGRPIDAFFGNSPDGRWVAVLEGGQLVLLDSIAGGRVNLSDRGPIASVRDPGSFGEEGRRFLFLRGDGPARSAQILDLRTGAETRANHGGDALYDAALARNRAFIEVLTYHATEAPEPLQTTRAQGTCRGPALASTTWGPTNLAYAVAPIAGGPAREDVLAIAAPGVLVRDRGALMWYTGTLWRPALPFPEDGRVLAVGADGGLLILEPPDDDDRADVTWWSRDMRRVPTGFRAAMSALERRIPVGRLYLHRTVFRHTWMIDLETGARIFTPEDCRIAATHGALALLHDSASRSAYVADLATKRVSRLPGRVDRCPGARTTPPWGCFLGADGDERFVDLSHGRLATLAGGGSLAVSADGMSLRSSDGESYGVVAGPLHWEAPRSNEALVTAP